MQATLLLSDGSTAEASKDAITQELASTKPFWLDLVDIDATALSWEWNLKTSDSLSDLVDSYRDLLTSAVDTHLSTVSNRLNEVMKQLAIIATIFLPLSWLTGFFGQNFYWLVSRLGGPWVFFVIGIGSEAVAIVILVRMFRKRGWIERAIHNQVPAVSSGSRSQGADA